MNCKSELNCQWLPLALFDSHSQFVLMFRELCYDVGIDGDVLHVTQTGPAGEYRSVSFGSEIEFECFLRIEFRRTFAATSYVNKKTLDKQIFRMLLLVIMHL